MPGQLSEGKLQPVIHCSVLGFLGEQNGHLVFEQDRVLTLQSLPAMMRSIETQINVAFKTKLPYRDLFPLCVGYRTMHNYKTNCSII